MACFWNQVINALSTSCWATFPASNSKQKLKPAAQIMWSVEVNENWFLNRRVPALTTSTAALICTTNHHKILHASYKLPILCFATCRLVNGLAWSSMVQFVSQDLAAASCLTCPTQMLPWWHLEASNHSILYMQQLKMLPQVLAWPGDAPASKVMASCLRNGSVYFDGKNMEQISGNLIWIYLNLWDIHLAFFRLSGFSSASFSVPPHLPNSFVCVITWCGFNFPMPQIIQELGLQHLKSPGVGWKQYLLGMLAHSPSTDPRSFRSLF